MSAEWLTASMVAATKPHIVNYINFLAYANAETNCSTAKQKKSFNRFEAEFEISVEKLR